MDELYVPGYFYTFHTDTLRRGVPKDGYIRVLVKDVALKYKESYLAMHFIRYSRRYVMES